MLEKRPLSAAYLAKALPLADKAIRALERKRFIAAEEVQTERDPLRAPSANLRVELEPKPGGPEPKLNKPERELLAFLAPAPRLAQPQGPGGYRAQRQPRGALAGAQEAGRHSSRRPWPIKAAIRARHDLNPAQQAAFEQIHSAIQAQRFQTFLLHGVTGSGKTEVYLTPSKPRWPRAAARCCWCRRSR